MARKLNADVLSEFCRQIGALTKAGIPVVKAMEILKMSEENRRISNLYGTLEEKIKSGCSIGDSMEEIGVFPDLTIKMFRAAEISGQLDQMASRLAEHYRKEHRLKNQIKTATLYPKLVCIMAVGIVLFIFLGIMPMVESLFVDTDLPVLTQVLMYISKWLKESWYLAAAVLVCALIIWKILFTTDRVERAWNRFCIHTPLIGKQLSILYTARFARSQSELYASGVSMVEGLKIAAGTMDSSYLEAQFEGVVRDVKNGDPLSLAIARVDGFDKKIAMIIRVGEETGELDAMLDSIAEGYEYEAEMAINRMVSMIEPAMILVIGLVVLLILLGIMKPMWTMYEYIGY